MSARVGLLERRREGARLRQSVEDAAGRRGGVLLLEGPAGIGKSALLGSVAAMAAEHDATLLRARAAELDRGFAFGVVRQLLEPPLAAGGPERRARLLDGAAGRAGALFDGRPPEAVDPEYGILSGVYWLLANLAEEAPLVLCVDDLHWADVASLRLLEFLGRRAEGLALAVVGTLRPDEPGAPADLLVELAAGPVADVVRMAPLGAESAAAMLAGALGRDPDPSFVDAAQTSTGGNPLLLETLAREAGDAGMRGGADETARLSELGARGVAPSVLRRLRPLGVAAQAVARAAAVGGERATVQDVATLAEVEVAEARTALDELARVEVLERGGTAFVHPLVRAAVVESMPRAERMRMHGTAAGLLTARGARPTEVAAHHLASEPAGDPQVVASLRAAAASAAAEGATETAVDLLGRALREPPTATERPSVLLELGELELRAQHAGAPARLEEALAGGLAAHERVRAQAARAFHLVHTDPVTALRVAGEALAEAEEPGLRLRLEAFVVESLTFVDAFTPELDARLRAGAAATEPSSVMLAHLALRAAADGTATDAVDLARRSLADGSLLDEVGPGGSTWNLLTHALRFAEDAVGARRVIAEGERLVEARGLRIASFFVDQTWGYWHRDFGSAAAGAARAQLGFDRVLDAGLDVTAPALAAITAENLVRLDRLEEAATFADRPIGPAADTFMEPFALTARAVVRAADGRVVEAEADLRRVVALGDARGFRAPLITRGRVRLAELLAAQGRREEALELADHDIAAARRAGTAGGLGEALRVRGLALDGDEALAVLGEAAATLATSPLRHDHARALYDLGAAHRRRGGRVAAREALRLALDIASRTESTRLARMAREELAAAGGRARREHVTGVGALTPSERRVAELAAEGRTNREIAESLWVTRKTVEVHLGSTYGKLGIRSRSRLAEALGEPVAA